jgi:hypothetical protein
MPPGGVGRIVISFHSYAGGHPWRCYTLEHEANDMMRPYEILAWAGEWARTGSSASGGAKG